MAAKKKLEPKKQEAKTHQAFRGNVLPMANKTAYVDPLSFDPTQQAGIPEPMKEQFVKMAADVYNLNAAILRALSSPDGQILLNFLKSNTLDASTWSAALAAKAGIDAANANGYAREGQNALVRDIMDRMAIAQNAKSPEDYMNALQQQGAGNGTFDN